jgi:O-antigen ligase
MPTGGQRGAATQSFKLAGGRALALMPLAAIFYVLLVLPFIPDDGSGRPENILFWPAFASVVMALVLRNLSQLDSGFFRSLPIASLLAYFLFAAASIVWAYNPDFAFSRFVSHVLVLFAVVLPYALPLRTPNTIPILHLIYFISIAINAAYVLTIPPTPIGHAGYFTHKQELGMLCATALLVFSYEVLFGGWRRVIALIGVTVGFWLLIESESKSALAFAGVAMCLSFGILLACKYFKTTPAWIIGAVTLSSLFFEKPISNIAYRLYGDVTLTGRTDIWAFIEYQIAHKPWFGWGFHSYYGVPNSPHNQAWGFVKDMPSSHSGFMELRLETGRIGYAIFLVFIYASLHYIERVRRVDPRRAWFYLSVLLFSILLNLLDSVWLTLSHLWLLQLLVIAESVRYSRSAGAPASMARDAGMRETRRHRGPLFARRERPRSTAPAVSNAPTTTRPSSAR